MKVLHITPHLGGGVGKAHAAMGGILASAADQTFLLLEEARDRRHLDVIAQSGAHVATARDLHDVVDAANAADIVQFEFWNHPRLFECLARGDFPAMRTVFWSHISGLSRPVIQPGLVAQAGRFVFSTPASLALPFVTMLPPGARMKVADINSGFGFSEVRRERHSPSGKPAVAYLGTVDFAKMHPGFFDAIDGLEGNDIRVSVWGSPSEAVIERARAMRHPDRIRFGGHTSDPAAALAEAGIFFYPLQPNHYGTAENALVEAMSLGLAPVVLDNPAEAAIVRHGETGLVAHSIAECAVFLDRLLSATDLRERISRNAALDVADKRSAQRSARQFADLWQDLMAEPPRLADFRSVIGACPADWFLATQCLAGERWDCTAGGPDNAAKGTLAHFESVFPDDASLAGLRHTPRQAASQGREHAQYG